MPETPVTVAVQVAYITIVRGVTDIDTVFLHTTLPVSDDTNFNELQQSVMFPCSKRTVAKYCEAHFPYIPIYYV